MEYSNISEKKSSILINDEFDKKSLAIMSLFFIMSTLLITSSLNILTSFMEIISFILLSVCILKHIKHKIEIKMIERKIYRNYLPKTLNKIETLDFDKLDDDFEIYEIVE